MTGRKMWRIRNIIVCASVAVCLLIAGIIVHYQAPILSANESGRDTAQNDMQQNGIIPGRLERIDSAVEAAISEGEVPGAVVLVSRQGRIEYFKAFGNRSLQPKKELMTKDTIFDVSSLTKVLATTPSIMLLVENGLLRIGDPVYRYLPRFKGGGKDDITVSHLLTHYSGLPADLDLSKGWFGYDESLEELWKLRVDFKPGKEFVYSDVNFIALGEIIHAVSGKTIDVFARENIFNPLGMTDTCYRPTSDVVGRIAPTESRGNTLLYLHARSSKTDLDKMLRGEVHDPTAYRMGGVAGHAGLFSSAKDLAVYAQMLLDRGKYSGGRLLSPITVQAMSRPQSPPGSVQLRGYGWDIRTDYSSPRGDIFGGGYGHTGFTGTSLWIHPPTETFVVILSNRVHPNGGKNMNHLRSVVANIVASAISDPF
ncbi:MAG: beta-lactamase family protein [Acidobacteria bacterium]|nr:beta-lactamase family protein [Acidobacteriota bacterium]